MVPKAQQTPIGSLSPEKPENPKYSDAGSRLWTHFCPQRFAENACQLACQPQAMACERHSSLQLQL